MPNLSMSSIPPYGVAFAIEELLLMRSWVRQRDLQMTIATDQVINGAEFEEMLMIAPSGRERRCLTVWRTHSAVFVQTPQGRPRAFGTLKDALSSLRPTRAAYTGWRRLFRAAS